MDNGEENLHIEVLRCNEGGRPGGVMVKFTGSTLVAQGSLVQIPGTDLHTAQQAMLWLRPTYDIEEDWHRC